jgi:hypothetical protein
MKFTHLDIWRARVNKGLSIPAVRKIRDDNAFPCRNMNKLIIMQVYTYMIYPISSERKHEISFFKFIDLFLFTIPSMSREVRGKFPLYTSI